MDSAVPVLSSSLMAPRLRSVSPARMNVQDGFGGQFVAQQGFQVAGGLQGEHVLQEQLLLLEVLGETLGAHEQPGSGQGAERAGQADAGQEKGHERGEQHIVAVMRLEALAVPEVDQKDERGSQMGQDRGHGQPGRGGVGVEQQQVRAQGLQQQRGHEGQQVGAGKAHEALAFSPSHDPRPPGRCG